MLLLSAIKLDVGPSMAQQGVVLLLSGTLMGFVHHLAQQEDSVVP